MSNSELLKANMQKSLDVMLNFWELTRDGLEITAQKSLTQHEYPWLKPSNHNQLRITRTIHSLAIFRQIELAKAMQQAVTVVAKEYGDVSENTISFWQNATEVLA